MVLDGIMENANEKSASLSFVSSYQTCWSTNQSTGTCDLDNLNLRRQSSNPKETWLDAEIVVEGKSVAVNRSILSERSQFFRRLFNLRNDGSVSGGKPKYLLTDLVPYDGKFGFEAFNDILHYIYTGMNKESPPEVSTCVDDACAHDACSPVINYVIELMYASAAFQMKKLVIRLEEPILVPIVQGSFCIFCRNYHGTQILPESLLKEYILADPLLPYTSNVGSIFVCKMFYDLAQLISADNFKSYSSFSNIPRLEWSNSNWLWGMLVRLLWKMYSPLILRWPCLPIAQTEQCSVLPASENCRIKSCNFCLEREGFLMNVSSEIKSLPCQTANQESES
ncbi:hypothetical protein CUMW_262380 [Citrus unshiu]|uniref:Uncharacterized protein n=1 Tax=Citrus unshiu TaxID=55188 RepID=A0A2H5QVA3_CITUN|nr:hypothetical protein CUMW_262380 [Citrus unshiu]